MDLNCECGEHSHFDGLFAYAVECPGCKQQYKLADNVVLEKIVAGTEVQVLHSFTEEE